MRFDRAVERGLRGEEADAVESDVCDLARAAEVQGQRGEGFGRGGEVVGFDAEDAGFEAREGTRDHEVEVGHEDRVGRFGVWGFGGFRRGRLPWAEFDYYVFGEGEVAAQRGGGFEVEEFLVLDVGAEVDGVVFVEEGDGFEVDFFGGQEEGGVDLCGKGCGRCCC